MSKRVYVLGAGASRAVNAPLQAELLFNIFDIEILEPTNNDTDFMSLSYSISAELLASYPLFLEDRKKVARFIINNFGNKDIIEQSNENKEEMDWPAIFTKLKTINISLENLFTILDKITFNHDHFRYYRIEYINEVRLALNRCIIYSLSYCIEVKGNRFDIYENLCQKLVKERVDSGQKEDPFSIITLNWDNILDKYIYHACEKYNNSPSKEMQDSIRILPDYCCYNYYLQESHSKKYMPSFHVKAKGNYNIKIMKLHGSVNWLFCPKCGRMFIEYDKNIALKTMVDASRDNLSQLFCRFCSHLYYEEYIQEDDRACCKPALSTLLVTPTFLKELNNIHLKNIWHNAHIDLSEADEVIFIGYSFPDADFEIRYLLKQSISPSAKIKVVLASSDDPKFYMQFFNDNIDQENVNWL